MLFGNILRVNLLLISCIDDLVLNIANLVSKYLIELEGPEPLYHVRLSVRLSVTPAVSGADEQQKTMFGPTYSARFQYGGGKYIVRIATCT